MGIFAEDEERRKKTTQHFEVLEFPVQVIDFEKAFDFGLASAAGGENLNNPHAFINSLPMLIYLFAFRFFSPFLPTNQRITHRWTMRICL